jgi:hypothetical protein
MKKRVENIFRTVLVLWNTFSPTAKTLVILFVLSALVVIALSSDRGFMAFLCLGMILTGFLAGFVVYRLLSREIK